MNRRTVAILSALLVTVLGAGCGADEPMMEENNAVRLASLDEVTPEQWASLGNRRFFFGHQSVGRNILAGMRELLAENPQIPLQLANAERPSEVEGAAFIEANIGRNGQPGTKADAFRAALDDGFGSEPGAVAMYKYCYVDVQPSTDPDALFEDYAQRTASLKARYPELTLVHITLPLRVAPEGPKEWLKTVLGRETETELNLKRNRFNERLRAEYAGTDPIFDLAALQSLRADGTRAFTRYRGEKVYMLAPEWSNDGGHLNEAGQRRMAEQLLAFLATLESPKGARVAESTGTSRP